MPEPTVPIAVLIAGFLSAFEITELRGKLSGRTLAWDYTSYPRTLRKLRSTNLRIEWVRLHYLPAGQTEDSHDNGSKAGLEDKQFTRLVIPLQTADKVLFTTYGQKDFPTCMKRLPTGALCYIDNRQPLRIENGEPRMMAIHLMLDVYGSDQLRQLIRAAAEQSGRAAATV